jgi:hypothetical protein
MSAYLIVTIALLPVSPIIKVAARVHNRFLTKFGVDTKNDEELGDATIAGSVAIIIICLAFYAFIVLGILDLLGLLKFFMRWRGAADRGEYCKAAGVIAPAVKREAEKVLSPSHVDTLDLLATQSRSY